jgi:hypothetical protein
LLLKERVRRLNYALKIVVGRLDLEKLYGEKY